ncbi:MAG: hypothetical protein CLLPBCKN_000548 [Chroococcidiopsis cubana SAG 39.79]|uniref:methyltransferase domain-containing protein n=1 Tax=Chroococcidiopsis cubana TaxID=171392 RepID=UPI000D0835DC|nr:methyltransferase domain-containing protein [Chroococcidiopsis cubana]MDZ4871160.1 hypothetical protein [Chroococcidiopsis cubana SAG 39.79]PSB61443.1 methyltransferase type 11 [Chroococcidiopsis cubana CCALA 043]
MKTQSPISLSTADSTPSSLRLSEETQQLLCCPVCSAQLELDESQLKCTNTLCQACFPIVNGIPILIDDEASVFAIDDYLDIDNSTLKPKPLWERQLINLIPSIHLNLKGKQNYQKFVALLQQRHSRPKVLVVGSSIRGQGMEPLYSAPDLELVETDVAFGADVSIICDAHSLPFADNSFDGVVIQAVLEHVVDPYQCVAEVHRVLKPEGVVYSETPFMQQVHLGRYDFTRFTHLGHQRLFRNFAEIASGPVCGTGMALAWSYQYFLLSFVKSSAARAVVKIITRLTSFWLKYFDYLLIDRAGTYDAASGFYFLGTKSDRTVSDRELLAQYKGAQASSF